MEDFIVVTIVSGNKRAVRISIIDQFESGKLYLKGGSTLNIMESLKDIMISLG